MRDNIITPNLGLRIAVPGRERSGSNGREIGRGWVHQYPCWFGNTPPPDMFQYVFAISFLPCQWIVHVFAEINFAMMMTAINISRLVKCSSAIYTKNSSTYY